MKRIALTGNIVLIILALMLAACNNSQPSSTLLSTTETVTTTSISTLSSTVPPETTTSTESTQTGTGKEFIWKISSPTATAYLLGSVHVAQESIYPLDGVIEKAFESADNLVVEVDITNIDTNAITNFMFENGTYPEGDGLKNHLSGSLYKELSELFKKFGINIALLDNLRPWIIATTLEQLIAEDLGYRAESGIDYYFLNNAGVKDILELETAEFQLELLSSFPDELMIQSLEEDVENLPSGDDFEDLFSAWENGDVIKMESLVFEPLNQKPELSYFYEKMFDERNINMANQIFDFLEQQETYFVVVGAGHLVGEKGLINLIKEKNYPIIQLEDMD